uniref:AlNc14C98G5963 protein n=1 Tax=Albugo laibachii Nc14 TaxID=890382 RepID=F0WH98_9STRA|nr:AlNc14C98G5963 [Albugo laibachii Nc14]|eukprot:CCA20613.1 AlNc14C98G5963 [Albugo laibachii Nc14]
MHATRTTTKKAAWNASMRTLKPTTNTATNSATLSTTKRVGGGYIAPERTARATRNTISTVVTRVGSGSISRTRRKVFTESNQPRLQPNIACIAAQSNIDRIGSVMATQSTTALVSAQSTTRSPKSWTQSAVDRVGSGVLVQNVENLASLSLLDELNRVKKINAELSKALEDKTAQLDRALKDISGLIMANQKVSKRLESTRIEKEVCQS